MVREKRIGGKRVGPRSGMVKATFSLRPEELRALNTEARLRSPLGRPDASAVLRELIDAWMAGRKS